MFDLIARLTGNDVEVVSREWHSFWVGFAEMMCLRIPPLVPITEHMISEMLHEWHYYAMGRAAGVLSWVVILAVLL